MAWRAKPEPYTAAFSFKQRWSRGIRSPLRAVRRVSSGPVARMPCACQQFQLGASSGIPSSHGARPNPSLKRSANGSPPGPVRGAVTFSTARAWRATVVSRLAHTLGLACQPSPHRHRFLRLSGARSAGQVLSWLTVSFSSSIASSGKQETLFPTHSVSRHAKRAGLVRLRHLRWLGAFSSLRSQVLYLPRTSASVARRPSTSERCKA